MKKKEALSVCSSSKKKIATESNSIIPQDAVSEELRNAYAMEISLETIGINYQHMIDQSL